MTIEHYVGNFLLKNLVAITCEVNESMSEDEVMNLIDEYLNRQEIYEELMDAYDNKFKDEMSYELFYETVRESGMKPIYGLRDNPIYKHIKSGDKRMS